MPALDEALFAELSERHRRELQVHSYRMLGHLEQAEDAVQEALLRAWKGRSSFDGAPGARAWLYRIVTTTCLDICGRRGGAASRWDLAGQAARTRRPREPAPGRQLVHA